MWNIQKMKSMTFIHNDDVKCFHMVIQGTHKLIVLGHINLKDHVLIKRWRVYEKMNVMAGCLRMRKNKVIVKSSLRLVLEVVRVLKVLEFTAVWMQRM